MNTKELINLIFKYPTSKYELTEFDVLNINYDEVLNVFARPGTGKSTVKTIYYLKTQAPFYSDKEKVQVYVEGGKSNPEEIVRQLWVHKLIKLVAAI
jgi:type I restriction enzyme M protein